MSSRISTAQLFHNSQANVANAREKEVNSSEKAASGKEIVRPSQDPSGYIISSTLKDELANSETISKNAALASQTLSMTETIFTRLQDLVQRTHELALSASGLGGVGEDTRKFVLNEVRTIYESSIQVLNTRYNDRALLSGFQSQKAPFDTLGNFQGDQGAIEIEIAPGLTVPVNITGDRAVFGTGINNGVDILGTFKRLITGLETNNPAMIHGTLEDLTRANGQVSLIRGEIGSRMQQIASSLETLEAGKVTRVGTISSIEDADAIKVFSDLARDQGVLRAAISTSQKILSENPTDILFK